MQIGRSVTWSLKWVTLCGQFLLKIGSLWVITTNCQFGRLVLWRFLRKLILMLTD
ncbi:hypothetical protein Syun_024298 [Stephania yunnanensis]|uniref:Uncharacterized protein n=1 Tax=Stephania yunnanensis TaxID=152371 RepID=A0AAP0I448_9MAGN